MLMQGKKALVFGVVNERSIAYGIAKALRDNGAELALGYAAEPIRKRIEPIAEKLGAQFVFQCNVSQDEEIASAAALVAEKWGNVDCLVHSIAYANREDLAGRFIDTSREGFRVALDVSAYSLVALCRAFEPLFAPGASVMTMSYYGSGRVVANYNAMGVAKSALESSVRYLAVDLGKRGVRINAISAGPVKTMAASAISGFRTILETIENRSPLKRNVSLEDIGRCALYLGSDLSSGTTGEVIFVDSGYNIMGV
ncbi:enoyl-ACP reductase FabI [Solidesulfovibrio alcoholivorans]|uniref:enoyl-ACP reductase FabI n=1 Tax=Solidesulfovibrio alcoholivorans TaxID=81406 RepID=UPI000495366E|nr:enoyl-ACP reductase [Solidesulfovibrio alcoholivorans]